MLVSSCKAVSNLPETSEELPRMRDEVAVGSWSSSGVCSLLCSNRSESLELMEHKLLRRCLSRAAKAEKGGEYRSRFDIDVSNICFKFYVWMEFG